ncbi:hypothetical protein [Dokdonella immobilis]|uniref:Uncharacterized protein n=1 Tax=Dokdonella immobilis TaxID=578942 RepID=A0A1I4WYN9_9GAMM|nr:hypothetical protein [Dokdonella immobilis]SFN18502.1 hypothetical protein SAMN05216289_106180 [Dokdonella immobilis]
MPLPNAENFSFRDAALRIAGLKARMWLARLIGLPFAVVGGIMLAFAWSAVQPWISALHGRLVAANSTQARIVESRFVCESSQARQLALTGLEHVVPGEAGCGMREQALLRFLDASGTPHTVLATDPSDHFVAQGLSPSFAGDKFQRTFALVGPKIYAEPGVEDLLRQLQTDLPDDLSFGSDSAISAWTQVDALRSRMNDPLVNAAFAWVRPSASSAIELRYSASDPEHAWIGAFLDDPDGWNRVPLMLALLLGPMGIFVTYKVAQLFVGHWHRHAPVLATISIVLGMPLWVPHLFDVMDRFATRAEVVATLREDFGILVLSNDGRVEPPPVETLQALEPDAVTGPLYARLLDGLIPEPPPRPYKTMGAAFDALCAGVAERFSVLPAAERDERYPWVSKLQARGISTPGACLLPVAIRGLDEAFATGAPRPSPEYGFLMAYVFQPRFGSSFVADYTRAHELAETAKEALNREMERRKPLEQ